MNQNLEKGSVCQFYVVFGGKGLEHPIDGNVYIDADQFKTIEELKKNVLLEFQRQVKNNKKVSSEIIFWIPAENYRESAEQIMRQVGFNGKIEVTPLLKKENEVKNSSSIDRVVLENRISPEVSKMGREEVEKKVYPSEVISSFSEQSTSTISNPNNHDTNQVDEVKKEFSYSYRPAPVYHGDFEIPLNQDNEKNVDNVQEQSAFSNGFGSMRYDEARGDFNQQRGKVFTKKKPNAFVSLPVIIFVLSALLLISSAILLFVMD